MIIENKPELEKSGVLKWWNKGYKGQGMKIAILELKPPCNDVITDNCEQIHYRSKTDNNDDLGHPNLVAKVVHEVAPEAIIDIWEVSEGAEYIKKHLNEYDAINCSFTGGSGIFISHCENFPPIFCCAGNNGSKSRVSSPAYYSHTLAIGAYEEKNNITANYSQGGRGLDCVAYTDIHVPIVNGTLVFNGTSCASPFAAAMTLLWMQKTGKKNYKEVREFIRNNCVDVMDKGYDNYSSYGLYTLPDPDTIEGRVEDMEVKLKINSKTAYVNGEEKQLLRAPEEKDGTTLVPIRFIAETFGYTVNYNSKTREITIKSEN